MTSKKERNWLHKRCKLSIPDELGKGNDLKTSYRRNVKQKYNLQYQADIPEVKEAFTQKTEVKPQIRIFEE